MKTKLFLILMTTSTVFELTGCSIVQPITDAINGKSSGGGSVLGNNDYILPQGTEAECYSIGNIISPFSGGDFGKTKCTVKKNIYSGNGKIALLENGTVLTGDYNISSAEKNNY